MFVAPESMHGECSAYEIHMAGLEKMVRLRGGLYRLGLDGLLADMITWLGFNHATLHQTPMRFKKSIERSSKPSPFRHPRDSMAWASSSNIHPNS